MRLLKTAKCMYSHCGKRHPNILYSFICNSMCSVGYYIFSFPNCSNKNLLNVVCVPTTVESVACLSIKMLLLPIQLICCYHEVKLKISKISIIQLWAYAFKEL